jgi:outer membrane protein, adhesin transport system
LSWRATLACCLALGASSGHAFAMSLAEAVEAATHHNPAILAAQANRRATGYELLQSQGRNLPRVDLNADIGAERIDRPQGLAADINDTWRNRRQADLTLTQPLFDGWERINDIYRNASRVDAAAYRILARAEVLALDAVEAYINVRRTKRSLDLAQDNLANHRKILGRVKEQVTAGKVPASDIDQVSERLAGAEATKERIRQSHLEAEVAFTRIVGQRPSNLQAVSYPAGVPMSREAALSAGFSNSPLLGAASADADTARYVYEQSKSLNYPSVNLEVKKSAGADIGGTPGRDNEVLARVVLSWNLFDGMISRNRQLEFAERWSQSQAEEEDRRRAVQSEIERGLVAYQAGRPRIDALKRQASSASTVITNYETEYGIGKRSLLDLLNAETSRFNIKVELTTTEAGHQFAAYRVLSAMGSLLEAVKVSAPKDSHTGMRDKVKALGRAGNALEPLRQR